MQTFINILGEETGLANNLNNINDIITLVKSNPLTKQDIIDVKIKGNHIYFYTSNKDRQDVLKTICSLSDYITFENDIAAQRKSSIGLGKVKDTKIVLYVKPKKGMAAGGPGSIATATVECGQAIWNAFFWYNNGKYDSIDDLNKIKQYINIDKKPETIYEEIINSDVYLWNCVVTAKELYRRYGNKNYIFSRGAGAMADLETIFKSIKDRPIKNKDKWNPMDIVACTPQAKNIILSDKNKINNINQLNDLMLELYNQNELLPISLKMTGATENSHKVKFKEVNAESNVDNPFSKSNDLSFNYLLSRNGIFKSKSSFIEFNKGKLNGHCEMRMFRVTTNFQGEIKLKNNAGARHGKIPRVLINKIVNGKLPDEQTILNAFQKGPGSREFDSACKNMWEHYLKIKDNDTMPVKSYDEFYENIINKNDAGWFIARYTQFAFFKTMLEYPFRTQQELINEMISFAMSATSTSSVHIKVY